MEVVIKIDDAHATRSLYNLLLGERDLRGRVHLDQAPPPPGTLGVAELLITLGALAPFALPTARVLIAWIRREPGEQSVTLTRADGTSFTVHSKHVRGLDDAGLQQVINALTGHLTDAETHHDAEDPGA